MMCGLLLQRELAHGGLGPVHRDPQQGQEVGGDGGAGGVQQALEVCASEATALLLDCGSVITDICL